MKLLPVLDLMNGEIVRGVAGQRARYRPVVSRIARDSRPCTVAQAIVSHFGCREFYLADLDAIGGAEPAWEIYQQLASLGIHLIIDAGVGTSARACQSARFARENRWLTGIVVGLESLPDAGSLHCVLSEIGPQAAVFSLDLQGGRPLTRVNPWRDWPPLRLAEEAVTEGFSRLLLLDLAAVGVARGPATVELCRELRAAHPQLKIWSGGGVRTPSDMQTLVEAGCARVLVASALHDGSWTSPPEPEKVPPLRRLP